MAVTFHTLTGDVTDILGVDFPLDRVTGATLETNLARDQALVAGSSVRLPGVGKVDVQADGTFSVGNLVASDSADTNIDPETPLLYRVNIRYRHPQAQRARNVVDVPVWTSPWFELNSSGTTTLADVIEVAYLPASLISQATATLEAARDDAVADVQAAGTSAALAATTQADRAETEADRAEQAADDAVDISGIDTSDGVVSALVAGTAGAGPLTREALAALIQAALDTYTGGADFEQFRDSLTLSRLATTSSIALAAGVEAHRIAYEDTPVFAEVWADTAAWTDGLGQAVEGYLVGGGSEGTTAGHVHPFAVAANQRARLRSSIIIPSSLASSLSYSFVGLSTDTAIDPSGNNTVGVGIDPQTNRPTAWIGSAAGGSGRTYLSDNPLPAGEYHVLVAVDELNISLTLTDAAHTHEYRAKVARSAFPTINALAVWQSDSRGVGGAKIGALSAARSSATLTPRTYVEPGDIDTATYPTSWADLTGWSPTTYIQVSGGRAYAQSTGGASRHPMPVSTATDSDFVETTNITLPATSASGAIYVGVSGPVASGTGANQMLAIGLNTSTRIPAIWRGSSMLPGFSNPTALGSTALAAGGTYPVRVERSGATLTLTVFQADGTTVAQSVTVNVADLLLPITNIVVWLSDARGTSGASVGPLTVIQDVPVQGKTLEGAADSIIWTTLSTGGKARIVLPKGYDSRRPRPVIIYGHGTNRDAGAPWDDTSGSGMRPFFQSLVDAGYIFASADAANSAWGNNAAIDEYEELIRYVTTHYAASGFLLLSQSMGGPGLLNLLRRRNVGNIAAWYGIAPVVNLAYQYGSSSTFAAQMRAAYGIALDGSDFVEKVGWNDTALARGWEFRGVPMRIGTYAEDDIVPPAQNSVPFLAKVAPFAPEVSYITYPGTAHIGNAAFNTSDVLAFFQRWAPAPVE